MLISSTLNIQATRVFVEVIPENSSGRFTTCIAEINTLHKIKKEALRWIGVGEMKKRNIR